MNLFCGTDIIEIERIKKAIIDYEKEEKNIFLEKIFTIGEIKYCESKGNMKYQHYAARFAAKEAVFKAISSLLKNNTDISWKDIEILNDKSGRPKVFLKKVIATNPDIQIDVSLSHCKQYATAMVVVK